jgi:hypothetical protein
MLGLWAKIMLRDFDKHTPKFVQENHDFFYESFREQKVSKVKIVFSYHVWDFDAFCVLVLGVLNTRIWIPE